MVQSGKLSTITRFIFVFLLGGIILFLPVTLPPGAGDWDFQAYWSSTYLFAHHQDFSDANAMGEVERSLTTRQKPDALYAWFSPIGNVALLPFASMPFTRAVYYWLILNIAIVFFSTLLIWGNENTRTWIPLLAVFSFAMTVVSLIFGQVNTLEVLGLALFLALSRSNRHYLAGASLVLTTIKPHLVIITLPILMLDLLRKKQWKTLAGFALGLAFCVLVLFAYYPPWIQSFITVITSGMGTVRETPTINGLLVLIGEHRIGKVIWLIALLAGILWWWKRGQNWDQRAFIDLSIIVGLIVSPIGWSYDQIMLVFPILSILSWVANGKLQTNTSKFVVIVLIAANLFAYIIRAFTPSDVWFFWMPFVVLGLYLAGKKQIESH